MSRFLFALACALGLALTACGGSSNGTVSPGTKPSGNGSGGSTAAFLSIAPTSIPFVPSHHEQASFTVSGAVLPVTVNVSNPDLFDLSAPSQNGASLTYTVTIVAGSQAPATISLRDSSGAKGTVSVITPDCPIPPPNIFEAFPPNQSTGQNPTSIYFAVNNAYSQEFAPGLTLRMFDGNGNVSYGSTLMPAASLPKGSASPPPGYSIYFSAAAPALTPSTTYYAQVISKAYPCLDPMVTATFST